MIYKVFVWLILVDNEHLMSFLQISVQKQETASLREVMFGTTSEKYHLPGIESV